MDVIHEGGSVGVEGGLGGGRVEWRDGVGWKRLGVWVRGVTYDL